MGQSNSQSLRYPSPAERARTFWNNPKPEPENSGTGLITARAWTVRWLLRKSALYSSHSLRPRVFWEGGVLTRGGLTRVSFSGPQVMGTRTSGMKLLHEAGICLFTFLLAFALFLQYLVLSISPQYLRPSVHSVFPFQILQWCSARPFIKTGEGTDIFQYYYSTEQFSH